MTGEMAPPWRAAVAAFLRDELPGDRDRNGWNDNAMTAYQLGCDLLVALGYAKREKWGASAFDVVRTPSVWPRWDDVATIVLRLLHQHKHISFRLRSGVELPKQKVGGYVVVQANAPPPPASNILETDGFGPAWISDRGLKVLETLGVISGGVWAEQSRQVLWRTCPKEWDLKVDKTEAFQTAVSSCIDDLPEDVRAKLAGNVDVDETVLKSEIEDWKTRLATHLGLRDQPMPSDAEIARRAGASLLFRNENVLDWMFFEQWRVEDGWLSDRQQEAAIGIFHDPLAIKMKEAVVVELFPRSDMAVKFKMNKARVA